MSERVSIAITGAGGFVGSHLAEGLAGLGHRVVATDRQFDALTRARLMDCEIVESDFTASMAYDVFADCAVLVHGAALTTTPGDLGLTDAAHLKYNLELLLDALDGAERAGVGQIVFLSSSGVFAPEDGAAVTTEDTLATAQEPYALAKRIGEMVTDVHHGLSLRLGPIYGPHEAVRPSRTGLSLVTRLVDAAKAGHSISLETPERRRDWTYAPDLARAVGNLVAAPKRVSGVLHCGSDQIVSDFDLARRIFGAQGAASILVSPAPEPAKLPMSSVRSELSGFDWTSLEAGLDTLASRTLVETAP